MRRCLLVVAVVVTALCAGEGHLLTCAVPECKSDGQIMFGGGFTFNQVTLYCAECRDWRYLRWGNGVRLVPPAPVTPDTPATTPPPKPPAPTPMGSIWDPETGQTKRLFTCPKCAKPALEVASPEQIKHCPKCNAPGAKVTAVLAYD